MEASGYYGQPAAIGRGACKQGCLQSSLLMAVRPEIGVHERPGYDHATQEEYDSEDRDYPGPKPKLVRQLLKDSGMVESFFKAQFSDFDKKHAVPVDWKTGATPPPPEYRRIAPGLLEAVAEQLRTFLRAG